MCVISINGVLRRYLRSCNRVADIRITQRAIIRHQGQHGVLARALGSDFKGKASLILYLAGIASAFILPSISHAIYVLVAVIWLVPDRRIENVLEK